MVGPAYQQAETWGLPGLQEPAVRPRRQASHQPGPGAGAALADPTDLEGHLPQGETARACADGRIAGAPVLAHTVALSQLVDRVRLHAGENIFS